MLSLIGVTAALAVSVATAALGSVRASGLLLAFVLRWERRRCFPLGPVLLSNVALSSFVGTEGSTGAGAGVSTLRAGVICV